ncbi:heme-binding protein 2 [Hydra vulgaris]|uniref:Heme-binding protein 2 n=1 Tax=Hydra vulgaris TaxID=6087 RepID=T2M2Q0_HYDVU|nr:heme-binding protein 2 [Hydra vulgaris]
MKQDEGVEKASEGSSSFYGNLICPAFTTVSKGDGFEKRCYEESTWVTTSIQASNNQSTSFRTMFQNLFKYISGENDQNVKIPMTAPVLVSVKSLPENFRDIKMHFFVPPTSLVIPKPTSDAVKLEKYPKFCAYVRVFGGYQMGVNKDMFFQRKQLTDALDKAGLKYNEKNLIYAGYNSPFKLFNRHNEIMVEIDSQESAF